jgi:hypothetical protein
MAVVVDGGGANLRFGFASEDQPSGCDICSHFGPSASSFAILNELLGCTGWCPTRSCDQSETGAPTSPMRLISVATSRASTCGVPSRRCRPSAHHPHHPRPCSWPAQALTTRHECRATWWTLSCRRRYGTAPLASTTSRYPPPSHHS